MASTPEEIVDWQPYDHAGKSCRSIRVSSRSSPRKKAAALQRLAGIFERGLATASRKEGLG